MRAALRAASSLALLALTGSSAPADTFVGGLICSDTTWTLAGSPYIVTAEAGGSIVIGCDATLTIQPGVVVKFDEDLGLTVGSDAFGRGTLVARGSAGGLIRLTSNTEQQPGQWVRVHFTDYAEDAVFQDGTYESGSALEYVVVEYAGAGDVAAIMVQWASPWLAHCEIRDNQQGGLYIIASNAPPIRIESCLIANNPGGGIYLYGGWGHVLRGNTISGNHAYAGGALRIDLSNANTISGNEISGNGAYSAGGGIALYSSRENTVSANRITGNSAYSGGGIYFDWSGSSTIAGNAIGENTASWRGGGIYFDSSGGNTIELNTISANSAALGGAIAFDELSGASLTGNWIVENTASEEGGAIYLPGTDDVSISNCVIARNRITGTATTGGIAVNSEAHEISLAGDPDNGVYNAICLNDGYQVRNDSAFYADGRNDIDARYVFWGTCDPTEIARGVYDYFDDARLAFVVWDPPVQSTLGDLDVDGDVDQSDLGILVSDWGCVAVWPDRCVGDCDFDGDTDQADLGILLAHWGEDCQP